MLLKKAVVAACNPGAGGAASDTFVADPLHCVFDPASLVCKAGDAPDCLTPEQVETAARFYAGPKNPRTGEQIYPGWARGSEGPAFGWALEEGDPPLSLKEPGLDSLFKWVFGPSWDWRSFDFDHDMAEVDAVLGPDVNGATVANIDAFKAHGGKLLIYHGWADSIVNPLAHDRLLRDARQGSGWTGPVAGLRAALPSAWRRALRRWRRRRTGCGRQRTGAAGAGGRRGA